MYCVIWTLKNVCSIIWYNSPKVSVLFYINLTKSVVRSSVSLQVSVLFDKNTDKKCAILSCINPLKMSELFHMNCKIIQ